MEKIWWKNDYCRSFFKCYVFAGMDGFAHCCTCHFKNICVVCCSPKTMCVVLFQLFLIHSFSTLLITLFLFPFVKLLFQLFIYFSSFLYNMYNALQVFLLFVYATKNTGDVRTFYVNFLTPIFSKPVFKILVYDFA